MKKADEALIAKLVKAGLNDREIAERMGLYRETVGDCRRRLGLKSPGRKRYPTKKPKPEKAKPKPLVTDRCKSCIYHGWTGGMLSCDHILMTGRRRGCAAGDGCGAFRAVRNKEA